MRGKLRPHAYYCSTASTIVSGACPPPSSVNLIERFWKCLKRKVAHNRYYTTFTEYRTAVQNALDNIAAYWQPHHSPLGHPKSAQLDFKLAVHAIFMVVRR